MNKHDVTVDQILLSLKKAIVKIKGSKDETLSVDTLSDDTHFKDLKGDVDALDVVEMVMEVETELEFLTDEQKAAELNLYDEQTVPTLTVKSLAESILSIIKGLMCISLGPVIPVFFCGDLLLLDMVGLEFFGGNSMMKSEIKT